MGSRVVRLLQVCNVGNIVGGTAACAWSVTRGLPDWEHMVAFPGRPTDETERAFQPARLTVLRQVTPQAVRTLGADAVLLHNTSAARCPEPLPVPTVQYVHSRISPADADATLYCSEWLAAAHGVCGPVLYQGVPRPLCGDAVRDRRSLRDGMVVGRLCTPTARKWPVELVHWYGRLAQRFPDVRWEFVGCPAGLVEPLREACGHRADFLAAGWAARSHLWRWDALLYHHPSLAESFGRTAAEAMRAGCIPIVDRRGGFIEQVPAACGFLCSGEADFLEALEQLHDAGYRWRMSRACRAHADERFSLQRFGRSLRGWLERAQSVHGARKMRC